MTRLRIVPALFILMGVAASVAAAPPANQDPQLSIAGNKVVVKNLPAGATVMLFGVSVEHIPFSSSTRRYDAVLTDTDHDGTIEWTPRTKPIPQFSVWFAIDVVTGNMGSVAPTGFTPVRFDFPPNGLKRATDGKIVRMDLFTQNLEVIVVRPGEGAWTLSASDGGTGDADAVNDGHVQIALSTVAKSWGADAPTHFLGKDITVLVDSSSLRYAIVHGKE